jgi:hypothetical protein
VHRIQGRHAPYSNFGSWSYPGVTNANGTPNSAAMTTQAVAACQIVLVRAFYPWLIDAVGETAAEDGIRRNAPLYAAAAFRNEPYSNSPC